MDGRTGTCDGGHTARRPVAGLLGLFCLALTGGAETGAEETYAWSDVERVVAVGDVHGDYGQLMTALHAAKVIDARGEWIGEKTHLVQAGDVPDRGPDSRRAIRARGPVAGLCQPDAQGDQ